MADIIFKLNNVDYSAHVVADGYNVNYERIYQEWVDGSQTKHRDVIAEKIKGTFQMYFESETSLQNFISALGACMTVNHTYPVSLKVNNGVGTSLQSRNVFLDYKPVRKNLTGTDKFDVFEVTIEEP